MGAGLDYRATPGPLLAGGTWVNAGRRAKSGPTRARDRCVLGSIRRLRPSTGGSSTETHTRPAVTSAPGCLLTPLRSGRACASPASSISEEPDEAPAPGREALRPASPIAAAAAARQSPHRMRRHLDQRPLRAGEEHASAVAGLNRASLGHRAGPAPSVRAPDLWPRRGTPPGQSCSCRGSRLRGCRCRPRRGGSSGRSAWPTRSWSRSSSRRS